MRPLLDGAGTARGAAQSLLHTHPAELSTLCISSGRTNARCMALRGSAFAALLLRACFTAYNDCCRDSGERATLQGRVPAVYYPCEGICLLCVPCQAQCLLYACSARHSAFCLHVSWTMVPDVHLPFRAGSVHSLESIVPIVYVLCKLASAARRSPTLSSSLLHRGPFLSHQEFSTVPYSCADPS